MCSDTALQSSLEVCLICLSAALHLCQLQPIQPLTFCVTGWLPGWQGKLRPVEQTFSHVVRGTLQALIQYNSTLRTTLYANRPEDASHVSYGGFLPLTPVVVIQSIRVSPIYFDVNLNWTLVVTCPMTDAGEAVNILMVIQVVLTLLMLVTFCWMMHQTVDQERADSAAAAAISTGLTRSFNNIGVNMRLQPTSSVRVTDLPQIDKSAMLLKITEEVLILSRM